MKALERHDWNALRAPFALASRVSQLAMCPPFLYEVLDKPGTACRHLKLASASPTVSIVIDA